MDHVAKMRDPKDEGRSVNESTEYIDDLTQRMEWLTVEKTINIDGTWRFLRVVVQFRPEVNVATFLDGVKLDHEPEKLHIHAPADEIRKMGEGT